MSQPAAPGRLDAGGGIPLVGDRDDESRRLRAVVTRLGDAGEREDLRDLLGSLDVDQLRDLVLEFADSSATSDPKAALHS